MAGDGFEFVSWAEQRQRARDQWVYDPQKVRRAMALRQQREPKPGKKNGYDSGAAAQHAARETEAARLADPVERAKRWLGRTLGVPVYNAEVAGGPPGTVIVDRKRYTREELLAFAVAKGWREDGEPPSPALPKVQPRPPAPAAPPSAQPKRNAASRPSRAAPVAASPATRTTDITPPQPFEQEDDMVSYSSGAKAITVPAPPDVYAEIERRALRDEQPMGRAALALIERALAGRAMPHTEAETADAPGELRIVAGGDQPLFAGSFGIQRDLAAAIEAYAATSASSIDHVLAQLLRWGVDAARAADEGGTESAGPAPLPLDRIATDALLEELRRRIDGDSLAVARAKAAESKLERIMALIGERQAVPSASVTPRVEFDQVPA